MKGESAHVRAIQTLADLKSALSRFAGRARGALRSAEDEIRRTQEWLREREAHWQRVVEKCRREVERAQAALERCRRSTYVDRDGRRRQPDCSAEAAALRRAVEALREAEAKLAKVKYWQAQVRQAVDRYRVHARRLQELTTARTERAKTFLERRRTDLEKYRAVQFQAMQQRIAAANPSVRGREFENWANNWVFGDKHRITIHPESNPHLDKIADEGLGPSHSRVSDNYVSEHGDLWDAKAYSEGSRISRDQLRDYDLMVKAGHVYDSDGNQIRVRSINYLFSNRAAAEANASLLSEYGAIGWYVDDTGAVIPLKD